MCVIATAAKKRFIKREEVLESMRINSDGFFMAALHPNGTRSSIRTLNHDEAVRFFDESVKEDDAFVMHARIPSRGEKTLENVHGWEIDRIMFMHNMTITEVDAMMKRVKWEKTDSEFFFRKVFIPFYRGLGAEAYKDGKFHEDLDNIIQHFMGYNNKFCFIMPDNKVIRYGNWVNEPDRKENGEIAFYASNASYKITSYSSRAYYAGKGGVAAGAAGFCGSYEGYDEFSFYDQYGYDYFGGYGNSAKTSRRSKKFKPKSAITAPATKPITSTPAEKPMQTSFFQGKVLLDHAGVKGVCQLALAHMVLENAITCRYIYSEDETEKKVETLLRGLMPFTFKEDATKILKSAFKSLVKYDDLGYNEIAVKAYVSRFAEIMARIYEEKLCKEHSSFVQAPSTFLVKRGITETCDRVNQLIRILNIGIDLKQLEPEKMATGFVLSKDGLSMEEFMNEDLLGFEDIPMDSTPDGIQMLLCVINDKVDEYYKASEDEVPDNTVLPSTENPETVEPSSEETKTADDASSVTTGTDSPSTDETPKADNPESNNAA